MATPLRLGPLSESEALDAVSGNMAALGHDIAEPSAAALAKASQGFPQHIHGYLTGAFEAIDEHGSLEAAGALEQALQAGDQTRADYYATRLDMLSAQDAMLPVIEIMLATGRDSLRRSEAVAVANKASFDSEAAVRQAIAHGVLTSEHGAVSFGIPSFHKHMADLLGEHQRLQTRPL